MRVLTQRRGIKLGRAQVLNSHGVKFILLTTLEERSDGVTLAFLVQSLGRVSPEVAEQPEEGEGQGKAESKVLGRLGKTA